MTWRIFTRDDKSDKEQASGLFSKRESDAMYFENDNPWGAYGVVRARAVEAQEKAQSRKGQGRAGK